jgi:hypothetical protein
MRAPHDEVIAVVVGHGVGDCPSQRRYVESLDLALGKDGAEEQQAPIRGDGAMAPVPPGPRLRSECHGGGPCLR